MIKLLKIITALLFTFTVNIAAANPPQSYYLLKVYHYKTEQQQAALHSYLQKAYIPALHKHGIQNAGVFGTYGNDTVDRRIYVFIPLKSWDQINALDQKLSADKSYLANAESYINAPYSEAPYARLEVIILKAFEGMPFPAVPKTVSSKVNRIYELRSYESPTEKYHENKVAMFNVGDEIGIFNRLGFNAVFYGQVVAGSRMPNLMYMTVHANEAEKDAHWKAFGNDAAWKTLSAKEEYKNNMNHIDITYLKAAAYSDF